MDLRKVIGTVIQEKITPPCSLNAAVGILLWVFSIAAAGCSASGSGDTAYGMFLDTSVQGLEYETETQSGLTDEKGRFIYSEGERVTFFIGGITLGECTGSLFVTPVDLVEGAEEIDDPGVLAITRLLITLDADGDPADLITLSPGVRYALSGYSFAFTGDLSVDEQESVLGDILSYLNSLGVFGDGQPRDVCSPEDAAQHLEATMNYLKSLGLSSGSSPGDGGDQGSSGRSGGFGGGHSGCG